MLTDFHGKRVTVMGLGRFEGGVGVTRWLANQGARVLVTDREPADKLAASVAQVANLPDVELHLGGHDERDFTTADLVVVNPAVPPTSPYLQAAAAAGVPVTTEINLFVERCRARTIGITGSVGKSTTTAMIGHVLERSLPGGKVWVGGNLGKSLLDQLPEIAPEDVVALELSSFQLERTPLVRWSPNIAVITNITPNHLDWHGDFEAYAAAKMNIARFHRPADDVLIVQDVPDLLRRATAVISDPRRLWCYATPYNRIFVVPSLRSGLPSHTCSDLRLDIPGAHNRENAAAALAAALASGADMEKAKAAVATFAGLPHRLQRVAVRDGVTYYNDSKSTTPEAAITAMNAIDAPLIVILGGYDKGSDLSAVASLAARRAKFAACLGKTGPGIAERIERERGRAKLFDTFEDAVRACQREAQPGDAVLLSPACASWGMFEDYRQRGDLFTRLVQE
jgi:UDP-N-acetylmuramoylalanine--D-glutamate ligase